MRLPNGPMLPGQPVIIRPTKPPPRRRFRWGILYAIGAIAGLMWIAHRVKPAVRWDDVARAIGVRDFERARMLVCLGLVAVAICIIARVCRANKKENE